MGRDSRKISVCLLLTALAAPFFTGIRAFALAITEISYHPRQGGRTLEFIEIHNERTDPVDLTGYTLRGVDFTFPEPTFLAPRAFLVICADQNAVRATFGIDNTIGNWAASSGLDNDGERIELVAPGGRVAASVRYSDRAPWPAGADGTGHTLELLSPYLDGRQSEHWSLSAEPGGSPGQASPAADPPAVVLNEAGLHGPTRWVELYNPGSIPCDVGGVPAGDSPRARTLGRAALPLRRSAARTSGAHGGGAGARPGRE